MNDEKAPPRRPDPGRPRLDGAPVSKNATLVQCQFCGKAVRYGAMLDRHTLRWHADELKRHACAVCEDKFLTSDELLNHVTLHWRPGGPCPLSAQNSSEKSLAFTRHANLKAHLFRCHAPDSTVRPRASPPTRSETKGPQVCEHCNKSFGTPSRLKRHVRTHTGEKPYTCAFCGLRFQQKSGLVTHIRTHNNLRPHGCPKCPMAFVQKGNMLIHLKRVHPRKSGEAKQPCPHCSCTFRASKSLKSHLSTFHAVLTEDQSMSATIDDVLQNLASLKEQSTDDSVSPRVVFKVPESKNSFQSNATVEKVAEEISVDDIMKTAQLKSTRHECVVCKKSFLKSSNLKRHLLIHSKSFEPEMRNKGFPSSSIESTPKQSLRSVRLVRERNKLASVEEIGTLPTVANARESSESPDENVDRFASVNETVVNLTIPEIYADAPFPFLRGTEEILDSFESMCGSQPLDTRASVIDVPNSLFLEPPDVVDLPMSRTKWINPQMADPPLSITSDVDCSLLVRSSRSCVAFKKDEAEDECQESQLLPLLDSSLDESLFSLDPKSIDLGSEGKEVSEAEEAMDNANDRTGDNVVPDVEDTIESSASRDLQLLILQESLKPSKAYKNPPLPHRCDECPASFKKPSDLVRHRRVHTGEKPFACDRCDKAFSTVHSKNKHQNVHLPPGERKMAMCKVCGNLFVDERSMKLHMRLHTGSMPYACALCPKTFRTTGHRTAHSKKHFRENEKGSAYKLDEILELCKKQK